MRFSTLTRSARDTVLGFGFGGLVLLTAALATADTMLDADGDGLVSLAEVQAVYPDLSEDQFAALDADGNGSLDEVELTMAHDVGLLPDDA